MTTVITPSIDNIYDGKYDVMDEYELYENGFILHNKYQYIKVLQNGSFGKVTLAQDKFTGSKYLIKSMSKKQGLMFRHEINIMTKLGEHPNLVKLVEFFNTKKNHILVLDYCDDGDLYDKIDQGLNYESKPVYVMHLIRQLINVINYMHSKKIYHRDIKPENILLMSNGDLKLCDFGLSTVLPFPIEINIGTEKYMSPESIDTMNYDAKLADYWSLGITICFVLFGKCPFTKAALHDENFTKFINNPNWLLSYYNQMSLNTFKSLMNLISLSPLQRNISIFEKKFVELSLTGITINQETELSSKINNYVFEMDDEMDIDQDLYIDFNDDEQIDIEFQQSPMVSHSKPKNISIPPPSLATSMLMNSFSWADDEIEDFSFKFNDQHLQYIKDDMWFNEK